jgi:two-component system nitrate/nitrite response regulator NarL
MRLSSRSTVPRKDDIGETTHSTCAGPTRNVRGGESSHAGIVLIDDDWAALLRLRNTIEQRSDLTVVAACRCAEGAMLAVQKYRPAVVILDVRLPDRNGFELIRDITAISETKVVVFTAALQKTEIVDLLQSGAAAIVFKDEPASTLMSCLYEVLAEGPWISRHNTTRKNLTAEACGDENALSPREREVAQCAAAGARNKEIAWQLGISEGTVKLHLFHAYHKLRVSNRVELVLALRKAAGDTLISITLVCLTFV